ncbi:MAG: MFS transporter [Hyphomonas sp.]|jgi:MFS family permease|uniref:MFS transporter n=2 Tax=Hyphomonas sp. TaxID=87 RepID=UPI00326367D2
MSDAVIPEKSARAVPQPERAKSPISAVAIVTISVLIVFYLMSFADKQMFSLLVDPIGANLALSDVQLGVLNGIAFSSMYITGVLIAGWCVDRFEIRTVLFLAVAFWSFFAAFSGLANDFGTLFIARGGVGLGEAFLPPAAYALLAATFPRDRLAFANGVYHAGANIGAVLTLIFGGMLIGALTRLGSISLPIIGEIEGWQGAFLCTGLPGIALAFLAFFLPRTRKHRSAEQQAAAEAKAKAAKEVSFTAFLAKNPGLVTAHVLAVALLAVLAYSLITWSPAFLGRTFGWSHERIGWTLAAGSAAGGLGNIFWGYICDRYYRKGYNDAAYRVFTFATLIGVPFIIAAFLLKSEQWFIVLYSVAWFTASSFGPLVTAVQLFAPSALHGRLVAIQTCFVGLFAIGGAPLIVAVLADLYGGEAYIGEGIATTATVVGGTGVLLLVLATRRLRNAVAIENAAHDASDGQSAPETD